MLESLPNLCEDVRIYMEREILGGGVLIGEGDLNLQGWHMNDHGGTGHFGMGSTMFTDGFWVQPSNMGWLIAHEYGHHVLYDETEEMADAFADRCARYNPFAGY